MQDTQGYKKGQTVTSGKPDTDSLIVSIIAAISGVFLIASPFAYWYMGGPHA